MSLANPRLTLAQPFVESVFWSTVQIEFPRWIGDEVFMALVPFSVICRRISNIGVEAERLYAACYVRMSSNAAEPCEIVGLVGDLNSIEQNYEAELDERRGHQASALEIMLRQTVQDSLYQLRP